MKQDKDKDRIRIGYANKTEPIAVLGMQLLKITQQFLDTTREPSMWQRHSVGQRVKEAEAIKEVAKSLHAITKAW